MRGALLFLALVSAAVSAAAQYGAPAAAHGSRPAQTGVACPWLTEGSAAHVLGGEVSVTVTVTNPEESTCRFARRPDAREALEIAVGRLPAHTCPADSLKLQGIGNEAVRCRPAGARDAEMIAGRVRERRFTIVLRASGQRVDAQSGNPQNDGLEQIAEAVAGNLY